jgi:hypothetical protein
MSNIIQWADIVKSLNTIAEEQQAVSGMTVAEAATALKYAKSASGMYLKTVMTTGAESAVGTTATEVATATATEAASTTAVNLSLVEGAGGTAEVVGIGSVALPIAACIAGASGGYLIGKELNKNEAYSNFFDKLVYSIGDFVTGQHIADTLDEDNAPTVPLLYDSKGYAYFPSGVLDNVKNYLDSVPSPTVTDDMLALARTAYTQFGNYYFVLYCSGVYFLVRSIVPIMVYASGGSLRMYNADNTSMHCFYYNSSAKTWNYNEDNWTQNPLRFEATSASSYTYFECNADVKNCTYDGVDLNTIFFIASKPSVTLPSVITKYTPSTTLGAASKTDPNGKTWSKIYLPSTSPTEMPDGEAVPEVDPSPSRLTPYIAPVQPQPAEVPIVKPTTTTTNPIVLPNPEPDTSTDPYPAPDPTIDPSQLAGTVAEPVPEDLPEPVNTGSPIVPVVPSVPAPSSAKGLLHVYNPTQAQVDQFGEWLWTTFSGDLIDTIAKLFNNPMDAVIGLHELYCTPITSGTMNIRAGFLDSGVASQLVSSRYKEIKCGAVSVPEYWGNYLDYSPYTKSYCYLPFIGIVELNTDDIVGSGVEITYRVDTYNGSCIALITTAKPNSAESVTYQFEGNCAVSVPITSGMMTALQNGLMGIATTALSAGTTAAVTAATGGTALPATVLAGTIAAGATKQGLTSKNQVQYSGSFGSSFGAMGLKIPFLIIKRPKQKVVYGYNENYGYPAHKMVLLSTCSGYLKAIEVNVVSPTATEAEKKMIEQCLKSGVFVD